MNNLISLTRGYLGLESPRLGLPALLPNLLELGTRNKVVPLLSDAIERSHANEIPSRLGYALRVLTEHDRVRMQEQQREAQRLTQALLTEGIPHAVRKGPALAPLYKRAGDRAYEDIDLLVSAADAQTVQSLLQTLGYQPGSYNRVSRQPLPASREMQIQYRLKPDHLPHFHRRDESSSMGAYIVDVAFTSGWHGDAFDIDTAGWLADTVEQDGLRVLDATRNLVDVALHLYRETFLVGSVRRSAPCLRSFCDVYLAYRALPDPESVWKLCTAPTLRIAVRKTLELVSSVLQAKILPEPREFDDRSLLHCVTRANRDHFLDWPLLDRMAVLSHQEYEARLAQYTW